MFSLQFIMTSLLIILVPGTGVIYTVSAGLTQGRRAAIVAAMGCTLGIVPHLLAGILGLSALMYVSSLAFRILRYAGVAYLLYMAWTMWTSSAIEISEQEPGEQRSSRVVFRAILINLLNPKLTLFFFAFLPQFLSASSPYPGRDMTGLGLAFMGMTAAVFTVYGVLAAGFRTFVVRKPAVLRTVQKSFSGILALFALRLALASEE